jgi:hypothetical protein
MWYGKGFNDGDDIDAPRFIPVEAKPYSGFIPVGHENDFVTDSRGNVWTKKDWEEMRIK